MPIIETEIWKPNPDRPGTVTFESQRLAHDVFSELEEHLKSDGRLPDEYFLLSEHKWGADSLFPKDAEIICNANFGESEGVYLDIYVEYQKEIYEHNHIREAGEWKKRSVTERFATGKTLGESIDDLDKMNLVAASVLAAFYGSKNEILKRYARIESGEVQPLYPIPSEVVRQPDVKPKTLQEKLQAAGEKVKTHDAHDNNTPSNGRKGKVAQCLT
jgi:hypothetical protein